MTWLISAWSWFASTKIGRSIVVLMAVIAAFVATYSAGRLKGKHAQSEEDAAKHAEEQAAFGRLAQQTQTDAAAAAEHVAQDAANRAAPDVIGSTDFDNTGLDQ